MRPNGNRMDISDSPELLQLAEEVRSTGRPRLLRRGEEPLAMLVPVPSGGIRSLKKRELTESELQAFHSAAGSWSDMDVEQMLSNLYAARDVPDERPTADL